jgi:Holliday junction resolvasome RuvABC endonuclease subunit
LIILGTDQAKITGFCVMDSNNYTPIIYGTLDFSEFNDVWERNAKTKEKINELVDTYKVELIGLEDTFLEYYFNPKTKKMEPNPQSFKTLNKLLGVLECNFFEKSMCFLTWKKTEWQSKIGFKTNKKYKKNRYKIK